MKACTANQEPRLQMTSMIDIVFLLLIFFIVTLRIPPDEGTLQASVARADGTGGLPVPVRNVSRDFHDIRLMLRYSTEQGQFAAAVDGCPVRVEADRGGGFEFGDLKRRLTGKRRYDPNARVVIDCGDHVPYVGLVGAMDAVQAAGLKRIAFANVR